MEHERLIALSLKRVNLLFIISSAERCHNKRLRLAPHKECRAVSPREQSNP